MRFAPALGHAAFGLCLGLAVLAPTPGTADPPLLIGKPVKAGETVSHQFCTEPQAFRPCGFPKAACFSLAPAEGPSPPPEGTPLARVTIATVARKGPASSPGKPTFAHYPGVSGGDCYPIDYMDQSEFMTAVGKRKARQIVEFTLAVTSLNTDGVVWFAFRDDYFEELK